MQDYAHIFTPSDLSLEERVRAYREVAHAHRCAEASLYHMHNDEWQETLGSEDEIDRAFETITNSLSMAVGAFDATDLVNAMEQELLTNKEVREILAYQSGDEVELDDDIEDDYDDEMDDDDQNFMR